MLLEFQREVAAFLCGRGAAPMALERAPGGAARFQVYRRNFLGNVVGALAGAYPACERALGEARFAALARAFGAAHPPREADLHRYGEGFAEVLAHAMPEPPWLADLARLDWAAHEALHAADAPALDPLALVAAIEAGSRFVLPAHPSLRLLALDYDVMALRAALVAKDDAAAVTASAAIARAPEHLAVLRGEGEVAVLALSADAFRLASALAGGAFFTDTVSSAADIALLQPLLEHGCFRGLEVSSC